MPSNYGYLSLSFFVLRLGGNAYTCPLSRGQKRIMSESRRLKDSRYSYTQSRNTFSRLHHGHASAVRNLPLNSCQVIKIFNAMYFFFFSLSGNLPKMSYIPGRRRVYVGLLPAETPPPHQYFEKGSGISYGTPTERK